MECVRFHEMAEVSSAMLAARKERAADSPIPGVAPERIGRWIAVALRSTLALFVFVALHAHAADADLLVVAWDDAGGGGRVAGMRLDAPYDVVTADLIVDDDGLVRSGFGRVLHLSRSTGMLRLIDPDTWTIEASISIGIANAPRDVAIGGPGLRGVA